MRAGVSWLRRPLPGLVLLAVALLVSLAVLRRSGGLEPGQPSRRPAPAGRGPIVLDPAHGGVDSGAFYGGVREKDINLDLALRVEALLKRRGVPVVLTRRRDEELSVRSYREDLQRRLDIAAARRAWVLVAIHVNAAANPGARGTVILFKRDSPESRRLARLLREELERADPGRPHVADMETDHYYFDRSPVPTVAVEVGYLTNPAERAALQRPETRARLAEAIAAALEAAWRASP